MLPKLEAYSNSAPSEWAEFKNNFTQFLRSAINTAKLNIRNQVRDLR